MNKESRRIKVANWMIALACVTIFLAGWNVTLVQSNNRLDERLTASEQIRASEAKAKVEREKVACALSVKSNQTANQIISNIRKTILHLADAATNQDVVDTLRRDALLFPSFPPPECVK